MEDAGRAPRMLPDRIEEGGVVEMLSAAQQGQMEFELVLAAEDATEPMRQGPGEAFDVRTCHEVEIEFGTQVRERIGQPQHPSHRVQRAHRTGGGRLRRLVGKRHGIAQVTTEDLTGVVGEAGADDAGEQVRVRQCRCDGVVGGRDDDVVVDELVGGVAEPEQIGMEFVATAFGGFVDDEDLEARTGILPILEFGALVLGQVVLADIGHRGSAQPVDRPRDHVVGPVELPTREQVGDLFDIALPEAAPIEFDRPQ